MEILKIDFDEDKHIYRLDGIVYPSVTQIMKPLSSEKYGSVPTSILQAAAYRGSVVHESIENYIKYDFSDCPNECRGYFEGFTRFVEKYKPEFVDSEMRIYHKTMMYAGTLDLLCVIEDKKYIVDYKTTYSINDDLCRVQLEAYVQGLKSHGVDVDGKMILHLKNDGSTDTREYPNEDAAAWRVFCALKTVYDYMHI